MEAEKFNEEDKKDNTNRRPRRRQTLDVAANLRSSILKIEETRQR